MSKTNYKRLGDYIREVDVRNRELKVTKLVGLTINKAFIPSVANTIGTDLSNYKVIRKEQFACSLMQVSRDEKIPVAMFEGECAIMSPAYPMFEVVDKKILLPQYLMMWFSRNDFDREASFYAIGGVRGSLTWNDFCDFKIPIPPIDQQRKIVAEYNAIQQRIKLNEQLIVKLEETAQAIYRKMFVDGIDKNNLPEGWRMGKLEDVAAYVSEKIPLKDIDESAYISTENMLKNKKGIECSTNKPNNGKGTSFMVDDILISNIRPYFKKIWRASFSGASSNDVLCIRVKNIFNASVLYYTLEKDLFFDYVMAGSNGVKMPRGDKKWIMKYPIVIPCTDKIEQYKIKTNGIQKHINICKKENFKLKEIKSLILVNILS